MIDKGQMIIGSAPQGWTFIRFDTTLVSHMTSSLHFMAEITVHLSYTNIWHNTLLAIAGTSLHWCSIALLFKYQGPLLLTWFNFNTSMDK